MPTSTVEQYVKKIYTLQQQDSEDGLVALGQVSAEVGVVPGTATTMMKALAEAGLLRYEPRQGVRLTQAGEKLALHVLRRHRLVELFLVETLGLDWSEVHTEAEELEHVISDKVLDRIDALLGHPSTDPHGDPIPTAKGHVAARQARRLTDTRAGERLRVARVLDQTPEFLQFVHRCGLTPGTLLTVVAHDTQADAVVLKLFEKRPMTLGTGAATKIMVDEAP